MIETTRLTIVPFGPEHLTGAYLGWLNDPETMRFSENRGRVHTAESCRAYAAGFAGTPNRFFAILLRGAVPRHVGTATIYVDARNGVADMGILIGAREVWGQGIGTEAWIGLLGHAFAELGMRKVTAGTLSVNMGMLGIMRRSGMQEDGRRIRQVVWNGTEVDMVHAAAFAGNWTPSRP